LASVSHSKDEKKKSRVHEVHVSESGNDECENDDELGIYPLYSLDQNRPNRNTYAIEMKIKGKSCMMELDTAADFSIMSKSEYLEKFADKPVTPSPQVTLKTFTGEVLKVLGKMHCDIVYKGKQYFLHILVANYDAKPTLLGKNWLRHIKLEWGKENGQVMLGPIMVVPMAENTVRTCGDYKSTINQSVEHEQYVLPTTQDLYTALVGLGYLASLIYHVLMPS